MKLARVIHRRQIKPALVEEEHQRVAVIGGLLAQDLNPVRTIIERRISETELLNAVSNRVGFKDIEFLAPMSALVRNVFAVGKNYSDHAREFDTSSQCPCRLSFARCERGFEESRYALPLGIVVNPQH